MSSPSEDKKKRRLARQAKKDNVAKYINMLFDFRAKGFKTVKFADGRVYEVQALIDRLKAQVSP